MPWHDVPLEDPKVNRRKDTSKEQARHTSKVSDRTFTDFAEVTPDFRLTLDIAFYRLPYPAFGAGNIDLSKHQSNLTDGLNAGSARHVENRTSSSVEHMIKETPEKLGETASTPETGKEVVIRGAEGETSLEVTSEAREDYRKKR